MNVPPELLLSISEHLDRRDLKQLRLTCKGLAAHLVPYLFDSVFISIDPSDLKAAENILTHFGSLLKTVIVSPTGYREMTQTTYRYHREDLKRSMYPDPLPARSRFQEHIKMGYKVYQGLREATERDSEGLEVGAMIDKILNNAFGVGRIVITHRQRRMEWASERPSRICRWKDCRLPKELHDILRVDPPPTHRWLHPATTSDLVSSALCRILSSRGTRIKQLVTEQTGRPGSGVPLFIGTLRELNQRVPELGNIMANLQKLHLHIKFEPHKMAYMTHLTTMTTFLSKAHNLECLYLELDTADQLFGRYGWPYSADDSPFGATFSGCQYPKLRVLILEGFKLFGAELIPFLQQSPILEHLVLEECHLYDYLWKYLAESIKELGCLRSLELNRLYDGFGDEIMQGVLDRYYGWVDYTNDLDRFLHGRGPNPLTAELMLSHCDEGFQDPAFICRNIPEKAKEAFEVHF